MQVALKVGKMLARARNVTNGTPRRVLRGNVFIFIDGSRGEASSASLRFVHGALLIIGRSFTIMNYEQEDVSQFSRPHCIGG